MQRETLGKSGFEAAPQLHGRKARAFSNNSFLNIMEMTAAIQYNLTAAQLLGSQDYYKYLLGCLGKLGEVSKQPE